MARFFQGLLFLLLFNIVLSATAQTTITHLTTSDGLSQGMVTSLIQDKEGFIWVGTLDGLNRYDGYQFKTFTHDPFDTNSICGNTIEYVFEDSRGGIWVSVDNLGLDYYDKKTGRFTHLASRFPILKTHGLSQLIEMGDGSLWLNYETLGVVKIEVSTTGFSPANLSVQLIPELSLMKAQFAPKYIYQHSKDTIGFYDYGQLQLYNTSNHTFTKADFPLWFKSLELPVFCYDKQDNSYWILYKGQLVHWKNNRIVNSANLPIEFISHYYIFKRLTLDVKHNLWCWFNNGYAKIATSNVGKDSLVYQPVVTEGIVYTTFIDRQYRMWVGTNGYGLHSFKAEEKRFQSLAKNSDNHFISAIDDEITIRKNCTLTYLNNQVVAPFGKQFTSQLLAFYLKAPKGIVYQVGLKRLFNGLQLELYKHNQNGDLLLRYDFAAGIRIDEFNIKIDQNDHCWFSLPSGKIGCIFNNTNEVKVFDFSSLMPKDATEAVVNVIYLSKDGTFWLCTKFGLLQMTLGNNKQVNFKLINNNPLNPSSLSNNYVLSVADDPVQPQLYLWVATKGGGLNKFNKETGACEHFTTKDGLPNNVVYGILPDDLGRLWLSTNQGISCFIPSKKFFHNFTAADGLQSNEFNTNAYYKHKDGRLFFGGVSGVNIIEPNKIVFDSSFAPLYFTNLKINNKTIQPFDSTGILRSSLETTKKIELKHYQNFITISFAATNFSKLGVNHYRYKMDGIDKDWVYADTKNEISYPNLNPGTYLLHIGNSNENGDWNPTEATIAFEISPPWWLSNWAYGGYVLFIALAVYLLFQQQTKRLQLRNELAFKEKEAKQLAELDEFKNRFFANITHELRTPLTLIVEPARLLLTDARKKDVPIVQTIFNNSLRLLRLVNTLLDISKLEAGKMTLHLAEGDVVPLIKSVFDSFLLAAEQKQVTLLFFAASDTITASVDKPMLEKITHNLLSNALKFTPSGGTITLNLSAIGTAAWMLEVVDTGVGIPEKSLPYIFNRFYQVDNSSTRRGEGTGIGLALVKELVDRVNGTIHVKSKVGEGTHFSIQFATYPSLHDGVASTPIPITETSTPATAYPLAPSEQSIWTTAELPSPAMPYIEEQPAAMTDEETLSVLIVDDNADMRSFIGTIMHQQGYHIYEAANGQEGIDIALERMPTIIISDVMMPLKDGYELVKELKNNLLTSHIPIVLLTAKQSLDAKMQGYQLGADAYLSKPFHSEELLVRIKQLLDFVKRLQTKFSTQQPAEPSTYVTPTLIEQQAVEETSVETTTESLAPIDAAFLEGIKQYILIHIEAEIVIDDLATEFTMSRTQFYRKLTALTGLSPIQFIRNTRLDHAYQLLTNNPEIRISEVMNQVGMSDKKHFNTHFKERFGNTPSGIAKKGSSNETEIDG